MLPLNIIQEAKKLTESTSTDLFSQIQFTTIQSSLSEDPIVSSYVVQGDSSKPAIVLLHGFDSSLMEYRRLLPLLTEKYQVWVVDLLGFGFTQRQKNIKYSPSAIKIHLHAFWQQIINKPIVLAGASMGGATAIDFSLTYPDIVTELILLDSGGLLKQPIVGKFLFPPLGFLATEFLRNLKVRQNISQTAYFDRSFASEDALTCAALHLLCDNWNNALISFTKSGGYGSFAKQLTELDLPCLILWGKNDRILGVKPAQKFLDYIPHGKLIWIDDCGHVPHLEQSSLTANHILNFLA